MTNIIIGSGNKVVHKRNITVNEHRESKHGQDNRPSSGSDAVMAAFVGVAKIFSRFKKYLH